MNIIPFPVPKPPTKTRFVFHRVIRQQVEIEAWTREEAHGKALAGDGDVIADGLVDEAQYLEAP